jgi:hypothetical protein
MLSIKRDRGKALAADELGDDRRGEAAPAAVDGLAGAQPAGEREGGCCRHGEIILWEIVLCCLRPRSPAVTRLAMAVHGRPASNSCCGLPPSIGEARDRRVAANLNSRL